MLRYMEIDETFRFSIHFIRHLRELIQLLFPTAFIESTQIIVMTPSVVGQILHVTGI